MRISVPIQKDMGMKSEAYGHFGSAPMFAIYDTDAKKLEIDENTNKHHEHGKCSPASSLTDNNVDILVTGGIGMRALQKVMVAGVKVYKTTGEKSIEEIVKSYEANKLVSLSPDDTCVHHHH